jgi:RsiW-degrading membrane proteinase PrsW (M82 family)
MGEKQDPAKSGSELSPHRHSWWRILLLGFGMYFIGLFLLIVTGNPNLFPTVVLIGSFMVPVTFVAFFYERRYLSTVGMPSTALSFIYGGILGTFAASILEPIFIHHLDFQTAFVVGLIEEFTKILGVLVIARRMKHDKEMDGLVLGAAAGMGFAAFESVGYAFTAFMKSGGSLSSTVGVILLRAILSPVGHGTWTAIFASVLFRESEPRHFRINLKVVTAYFTVVILHGLWDGLPGVVSKIAPLGFDVFIAQAAVGTVGILLLRRRWLEARRLQLQEERGVRRE